MRLLHLEASGRPVLTNFHGKPIPPYAILSHRWGDSELLFEDLGSEAYKEKKDGVRKLKFCAKQAAEDNLQYFWIDTCCIDKWNNRERSRAINSMFRWYRNATRCYVFLSDVLVPTATDTYQCNEWEASFRASEWFTRGWTLQELIAPVSVEFFTREGWRLGNKASLEQLVHEITGIPLAALRDCPLDQFTTSERMTWANNRQTTEEEDSVYCLLGILDVAMPVSYREGRENALRRLYIEIEATSSAPSIIPFSQNDHFVGRESQLAELEAKLFGDKRTATTLAIIGPGGTGKSQLALELAYRTRQKNKNCLVFWIDANNVDSLDQSYASIAQKLDIPGWADEKVHVKQLVKRRLERERVRQCLLIFDNAEDISRGSSGLSVAREVNLADYLPQSDLCSVVLTATDINTAMRELAPDTAKRMLENYLDIPISASEQQQLEQQQLLQELSYLPLAIIQAAAYINTTGVTLQQYQLLLERQNEHTPGHSSKPSEDKEQERTTKNPVATTLFISIDEIQRSNTLAADYLFLTACVAQKDIPLDLLAANQPGERESAVNIISRYALITRRPADSALDVHRLVHRALREWLQQQKQLGQWTQYAITQLYRVFPDNDHQNRSKWRRLLPHAKHALSYSCAGLDGGDRSNLLWKYAMTLFSDGQYNEAEQLFVQVMETRKRVLGQEHPGTLTSVASLASTYRNQGRWKEAEELDVQVMETRKRVLGEEHPDTLASVANLASTYWNQGRWKEAEELDVQLDVQVMETSKRVLGEEHPDTLTSMANLASTYWNQGRWREAEELDVQVMETRKRVLGEEHPATLTSVANLASTYWNQGRWKEAEELDVQVMETRKRVLGEEHPDTLTSMNNLAFTLKSQSRDMEAFSLIEACFQLRKQVLGDEHPHTKSSLRALTQWQSSLIMNESNAKKLADTTIRSSA
ncbi:kinesin light chain [Aaosphaeria arxii CBS 175.79]|uniref:Kinesin light chain n=1 Tax=Aaosphaeria arxii CBS 175.79 TaxID=1450172 RepID=A0A6A5X6Z5_9PLEO|nr:kinesin light chain [Aaosphaeria arxii CBS 175.79]KAF2008718.1 kinesin light chain [Aaosphaeria arxii CBS 175.79]